MRWLLEPPLEILERHGRRYGDTFRLEIFAPRHGRERGRWPLARRTVVIYSAPDDVHEIFAQSGDSLRAGAALEPLQDFVGPRSLIVLDGAEHRNERREMRAPFGPERLAELDAAMPTAAARAVAGWMPGRGIDLWDLVDATVETMNLVLAVGARPDETARLSTLMRRARRGFASRLLLRSLVGPPLARWSAAERMAGIRRALRDVIARRLGETGARRDRATAALLDGLLERTPAPTEAEIEATVDRVITLLAGMENASAAAAWTCLHLLRTPSALERVRREVRAGAGSAVPGADSFLEAACKESLRLHPPFPVVIRHVTRPLAIGGYSLAPGTLVAASMYLMHRRPELFPEPEVFRPERFLEEPGGGGSLPFGAGARRCLGHAFASRQLRVVIAEMLRRFDIEVEGTAALAAARRTATVVPAGGVKVTVRPAS
jgi:cytochrome P450